MRLSVLSLTVLLLCLLSGCGKGGNGSEGNDSLNGGVADQTADITSDAYEWADSVCCSFTERQRIGQLFMPALYADSRDENIARLMDFTLNNGVGGIILLKGTTESVAAFADTLAVTECVMPFVAVDAEWGLAMRFPSAPRFPVNSDIRRDVDEQTLYDYGNEVARECRRIGINMVLGPVLDVASANSVIGRRSFGADRERVATLGVAYAKGLEDGGVVSVAKHFPGHGSVAVDSHKRLPVINRSLYQLDSIDLYPFKRYISAGLTSVMIGHLSVPSIDSDYLPAAVSSSVVTDLLRNDLGFDRLVLTDALSMKGAMGYGSVKALQAGVDMVMAPTDLESEIGDVERALSDGRLSREAIDGKVRRILFYKYLFGLSERSRVSREAIDSALNSREAAEIAKKLR